MISNNIDGSCSHLAGSATISNKWNLLDETNMTKGLSISLNSGDKCGDGTSNYSVVMNITCDPDTNGIVFTNTMSFNPLLFCNNTLFGKSNKGKI